MVTIQPYGCKENSCLVLAAVSLLAYKLGVPWWFLFVVGFVIGLGTGIGLSAGSSAHNRLMLTRRSLFAQIFGGAIAAPFALKAALAAPPTGGLFNPSANVAKQYAARAVGIAWPSSEDDLAIQVVHAAMRRLGVLIPGEIASTKDSRDALLTLSWVMEANGLRYICAHTLFLTNALAWELAPVYQAWTLHCPPPALREKMKTAARLYSEGLGCRVLPSFNHCKRVHRVRGDYTAVWL